MHNQTMSHLTLTCINCSNISHILGNDVSKDKKDKDKNIYSYFTKQLNDFPLPGYPLHITDQLPIMTVMTITIWCCLGVFCSEVVLFPRMDKMHNQTMSHLTLTCINCSNISHILGNDVSKDKKDKDKNIYLIHSIVSYIYVQ